MYLHGSLLFDPGNGMLDHMVQVYGYVNNLFSGYALRDVDSLRAALD